MVKMMKDKIYNAIYWILNILLVFSVITVGIIYKFNSWNFLLSTFICLGVIYPMLNLFLTLFKAIKKVETNMYRYNEAYLITILIFSTTLFYLVTKLDVNIGYDIWNYIFYSSFILIHVVFIILDRKSSKKDNSNGPKFIANK